MKGNKLSPWNLLACGLLSLSLIVALPSCDDDDDIDDIILTLSGNGTGAQEVPPVTTTATATLTGNFNDNTNEMTYTITWTGLSGDVVAAHFHGPADVGVNAPPLITLTVTQNGVNGNINGTETLTSTVEGYLKAGQLYYNLHTAANTDGEVRGQVTAN